MIYRIGAYKDIELEKFYPPFMVPSPKEDIVESITEAAKKGKVEDCSHKMVYYLGTFDTTDGSFTLLKTPEMILDLRQFAKDNA